MDSLVTYITFLRVTTFTILVASLACFMPGCTGGGGAVAPIPYTGDSFGDFALAIEHGDSSKAAELLDADPSLMQMTDATGQTALHYALINNNAAVVELLVQRGMDPNTPDNNGDTPLAALEFSGVRADEARKKLVELGGTS